MQGVKLHILPDDTGIFFYPLVHIGTAASEFAFQDHISNFLIISFDFFIISLISLIPYFYMMFSLGL